MVHGPIFEREFEEGGEKYYWSCLGIYKCPEDGCNFRKNSAVPPRDQLKKAGQKIHKHMAPLHCMGKIRRCKIHNRELEHVECRALMYITRDGKKTHIEHKGRHNHFYPEEPVSNSAREKLAEYVTAHNLTPMQMNLGAKGRPAAGELHPSLHNLDRIRYEMRKIDDEIPTVDVKNLKKEEDLWGRKFIKDACLVPGEESFVIQFPGQEEVMRNNVNYAFQTDSIEGWIQDSDHPNLKVTVTSVHSELIGRHVPVLFTVTFGRQEEYYQKHFEAFFKCLRYSSYDEHRERFPGNIGDFSDAERNGFERAVRAFYHMPDDVAVFDYQITDDYNYCSVHFQSTVTRVKRDSKLVPLKKRKLFSGIIVNLLDKNTAPDTFDELIANFKREFPDLEQWINWHTSEHYRGRGLLSGSRCAQVEGAR